MPLLYSSTVLHFFTALLCGNTLLHFLPGGAVVVAGAAVVEGPVVLAGGAVAVEAGVVDTVLGSSLSAQVRGPEK